MRELKGEKLEAEIKRIEALKQYEKEYEHLGYVCGIDEVGRGPFAGPVVACAVILPKDCDILYINDSKKLSEKKREELFCIIEEKMCKEFGKFYTSMKVVYGEQQREQADGFIQSVYDEFGEYLLNHPTDIYKDYIDLTIKKKKDLIARLTNCPGESVSERLGMIEKELGMAEKARDYIEGLTYGKGKDD